jgi:hypothetical protein
VAELIPTNIGDVLILWTHASFTLHAVGPVKRHGQQDFDTHVNVKYANTRAAAETQAKAMVATGGRIFFRNLDNGDWSEISR